LPAEADLEAGAPPSLQGVVQAAARRGGGVRQVEQHPEDRSAGARPPDVGDRRDDEVRPLAWAAVVAVPGDALRRLVRREPQHRAAHRLGDREPEAPHRARTDATEEDMFPSEVRRRVWADRRPAGRRSGATPRRDEHAQLEDRRA
jgi:hypothetical protein